MSDPVLEPGHGSAYDESKLVATAETMVTRLVKAAAPPKWLTWLLTVVCTLLTAVVLVLTIWVIPAIHHSATQNAAYTNSVVQHECKALELLTAKPVTYPANPQANPSRVATYDFYEALLYWEHQDGCKP